ncbi:MAG TPA: glycolate oxidase subunit GlcE [Methylococcaceae bacterium]|nr:glycolate oxidase subunit GlcE [Methylococcaceae bacterium]
MQTHDLTESIRQAVVAAINSQTPLQIQGGGSKSFYGREPQGKVLSLLGHQGIVNYHPSELVLTARTGTALSTIEQTLAEQGQMLAFEPPHFSSTATLGGAIACGFSGARRPFTGAARDFVLGCKLINGQAQVLSFGGEVMKNVAGYDVSRLMVGAMGTLGVLLEVSLKVLPKPAVECTQVFELKCADAMIAWLELSKKCIPLSGLSFEQNTLYVRLSGSEKAVKAARLKVGGEALSSDEDFWQDSKEQQLDFFTAADDLWRLSVPPAIPEIALSGEWFYEWGGAQRWLKTSESKQTVFSTAEQLGGHAALFRSRDRAAELFQPLPEVLKKLNRNLKIAFDPQQIFNPYRMQKDW